ncbi:MAG TPA: hypothetical protein VJ697_06970 [Nitrososphaeraceae archaeon]|nr:hypothetical protein [Nitrososphaeraceae archaeon]
MKTQNKMLVYFVVTATILGSMTSTINFVMAQQNTTSDPTYTATTGSASESVITRDSVTVLLEGKSVNPDGHIHLYDTGKFHIMDGHAAVKIPCNENSEPLLELEGGVATQETFMKKLDLHPVANMSHPGQTCMYHSDLDSAMGEAGFLLIDIALHNPSQQKITFPAESVAIVSVNEIMKDPNTLPTSEGDIPS